MFPEGFLADAGRVRSWLQRLVVLRLAKSAAARRLVLRGGLLTQWWAAPRRRPTRDLDFVGDFPFDIQAAAGLLSEALRGPHETEAAEVFFRGRPLRLVSQGIWLETAFPGVRVTISRDEDWGRSLLTMDLGFGDPLVPESALVWLPAGFGEPAPACVIPRGSPGDSPVEAAGQASTALSGQSGEFALRVVRPETQCSWKLHVLYQLQSEWRPKDLADLWLISQSQPLEPEALAQGVRAAFSSRGDDPALAAAVLSHPQWSTKSARVRWASRTPELPELSQCVAETRTRLDTALRLAAK